jgi:hypothetical protein
MNELQNIGWKRILLTRDQKFLLDLQTLGQEKDKVQKVIMAFENLANPYYISRLIQRKMRPLVYKAYWTITPKRLRVCRRGTAIYEFLPWFNKSHLYQDNTGRIGRAYGGDPEYVYSWKKAYKLMKDYQKQQKDREAQFNLNMSLRRISGGE